MASQSPIPERHAAWPGQAQLACAVLISLGLGWFGYRWCVQRFQTRPTDLQPGDALTVIDLNRADENALRQLPNVGPKTAEKIVADRRANGPFRSVDDLNRVSGVGTATVEAIRPWVRVSDESLHADAGPGEPTFGAFAESTEPVRLARKPVELSNWTPTTPTKIAPGDALIDLNTASQTDLQRLPGIGKVLAARIVEERQFMPFRAIDDLRRVTGIGAKTLERVRPFVRVQDERPKTSTGR